METMDKIKRVIPFLIGGILLLAFAGAAWQFYRQSRPINLEGIEIREYQGEQLSSVATGFRENSIKGPQYVDRDSYRLRVTGLVNGELIISYNGLLNDYQAYQKVVTLYCVEGWDVKILWKGLLINELFDQAGVKSSASTVIFQAVDGYTTSFPIEYLINNDIILAYGMNGVTIPPERGFPLMLVAESKWGYKWIKWITEIELSDNTDYQGYWESRGYSDSGDLDESFFK